MQWKDKGIILGQKRFGENKVIVHILTHHHGRYKGLFRNTAKSHCMSGSKVSVVWRSRLEEQLGFWSIEELESAYLIPILQSRLSVYCINLLCILVQFMLPERTPFPLIYETIYHMIGQLGQENCIIYYAYIESVILCEVGYGHKTIADFIQRSVLQNLTYAEIIETLG
jgi:DNA repair protein RecO (recombination protein O)